MFLIFGISPVRKTGTQSLRRSCPHCNDIRNFQEIQLRQYLSLFFIPILPVSRQTTVYMCPICNSTITSEIAADLSPSVLPNPATSTEERVVLFCPRCEGPMYVPLQDTRQIVICPHCTMEFKLRGIQGLIPTATIQSET